MDFNALISDLRSASENLTSEAADRSLVSSVYCNQGCKAIEKVSQSDLEYENVITGLWLIAAHLSEQLPHIKPVPSLSEISYRLFKESAKAVLNVQWQNLDEDGSLRQNFLVSLSSLHTKLLPRGFFRFRLFEGLSQNPWTHPTLVKVMGGEVEDEEEKEEVRKYIEKEDPIILQLRVDMMLQENCEEYALNLCTSCLQHPDLCSNLALRNKQLALLHSLGQLDKLQEECQKLSPEDAVRIIQLHQSPKSKKHEDVYTVLIQMFMVQNWIKPNNKDANKELLKIWICHQWMVDRERDRFKESVWAMAKLSQSTEQIVLFIDILREVCGDQYLQLYMDMCIFAINVDKSHMETSLKEGNFEAAAARRGDMASICSKLACLVHHTSNKVAKICALSAFALKPSENAFSIIGGFYGQGNNCCNKCSKDKKVDPGQINPATLYEVERLLNMLRPEYLNPENTFSNIQILCRKFLQETLTNVQQNPHLSSHPVGSSVGSTTQVEGPGKKKNFPVNKNVFEAISPQDVQNTQMLLNRMRLQSIQSQQTSKTVPTVMRTGPSGDGKRPNILQHQPAKVTGMTADTRQQLITLNRNASLKNLQSKVDVKGPQAFPPRPQTVPRQPPFQTYAQQQSAPNQQQAQGKQTMTVTQIIQQALQQDPNALKRLVQQGNPHMMDAILKLMNKTNSQSSTPQTSQPSAGVPRQPPLPTVSTLLKPQHSQIPDQSFQRPTVVRTNLQNMPTGFAGSAMQQRSDSFTQAKNQGEELRRLMQNKPNNIQQKDISQINQMSGSRVIFNLGAGGSRPKTTVELAQEASLARLQEKQLLKQQQQQKSQSKEGNTAPQQKPSQVAGVRITPGLHLKSQQQQFLSAVNKSTPSHQSPQGILQLPGQSAAYSGVQQTNSALPTDELSGSILGIDDNTFSELLQDPCILANTFPDIEVEGLGDDRSKKPTTLQAPAVSQQGQVKRTITFSTPPAATQQASEFPVKTSTSFYPTGTMRYNHNRSVTPVNNSPASALNLPLNVAQASLNLHSRSPAAGQTNQNPMKNAYYGLQDRVSAIGKAHPDNSILNRRTFPLEVIGKTPSVSGASNAGSMSSMPPPSTTKVNLPEKREIGEQMQCIVKQEPVSVDPSGDSSSSNNATYRCIICSLAFSQMDDLQEHVRSVCKPGLQSSSVYNNKLKQDRANSAKAGVDTNTVFQCLRCFELCISIKEHRLTCKRVPAVPSDIRKETDKSKPAPRPSAPKTELQDNSYKVPELPLPFPYPSLNANAVLNSLSMTANKSPKSIASVSNNSKNNLISENPPLPDPPKKHSPEKLPPPQYSEISGSGGSKFYRCKVCHQTLCSLENFLGHWKECVLKRAQKKAEETMEPDMKPLVGDVLKGVQEVIASVSVGAFTDDYDSEVEGSDYELLISLKDPCKHGAYKGDAFRRKSQDSMATSDRAFEQDRVSESKPRRISEVADRLDKLSGNPEFRLRKEETEEEEEDFTDSESSDKDDEYNDGMSVESTRQAPPRLRDRKSLKPIQSFINESFVSPYSKVEMDKNRFRRKTRRSDLPEDSDKNETAQLTNNTVSTLKLEVKVEKLKDTNIAVDEYKELDGKNEKAEEEHVCKLCSNTYKNNRMLVQHFVGKHLQPYTVKTLADTSSYFCHLCQKIFSTFAHYMIHVPNHSSAIHGKMKALLEQKSSSSQWSQRIATQRGIVKGVLKKSGISPTALKSKKRATKSAVERLRKQSPSKMRRKGRKPCLRPSLVPEESSDDSSLTDFHSRSSEWHQGEGGVKDGLRRRRPRLTRVAGSKSKASSSDDVSSRHATSVDEDYVASEDLESDSSLRQTRSRKRSGQSCSNSGDMKRKKLMESDSEDVDSICTDDSGRVTTRSSRKKADGASQGPQRDLDLSKSSLCTDKNNKVFTTDYSSDSNLTSLELSQENNEYVVSKSGSAAQKEDGLENESGHKVVVRSLSRQQKEQLRTCDLQPSVVLEQLPSDSADQSPGQESQQKESGIKKVNANGSTDAKNEGVSNTVHRESSATKTGADSVPPAKPLSFMDSFMSYVSSNYPSSTPGTEAVKRPVVKTPPKGRSDVSKGTDLPAGSKSVLSVESSSSPLSNTDQEGSNHSSDQSSMADTEGSTISYCTNSDKDVEICSTSTPKKGLVPGEEKMSETESMQDFLSKIPTRRCSVNLGERLSVNFLSSVKEGGDNHLESEYPTALGVSDKAVRSDFESEGRKEIISTVTRVCAVRLERSDLCDKYVSQNQSDVTGNSKTLKSENMQNGGLQKQDDKFQVVEKMEEILELDHDKVTAQTDVQLQELTSANVSDSALETCKGDKEESLGAIEEEVNSRAGLQNAEFNSGKEMSGESTTNVTVQEQNSVETIEKYTSSTEAYDLEMVKTEERNQSNDSEKKLVAFNGETVVINSTLESQKGEGIFQDTPGEKLDSNSIAQNVELNQVEKMPEEQKEEKEEDLSGKIILPTEIQNLEMGKVYEGTEEIQKQEEALDSIGEIVVCDSKRQNGMLEKILVPEEKVIDKVEGKELMDSVSPQSFQLEKTAEVLEKQSEVFEEQCKGMDEVKETEDQKQESLDFACVNSLDSDLHSVNQEKAHKPGEEIAITETESVGVLNRLEMATVTKQECEELEKLSQKETSPEPLDVVENLSSSEGIDGVDLKTKRNRDETCMESFDRLGGTFEVEEKCRSTQLGETCRPSVIVSTEEVLSSKGAQNVGLEKEPLDRMTPDTEIGEKLVALVSERLATSSEGTSLELKEMLTSSEGTNLEKEILTSSEGTNLELKEMLPSEETLSVNQAQVDPAVSQSDPPMDSDEVCHRDGLQEMETVPSGLTCVSLSQPLVHDSAYSINQSTSSGSMDRDEQSCASVDSGSQVESMVTTPVVAQIECDGSNKNCSAAPSASRTSELENVSHQIDNVENTVSVENQADETKAKSQEGSDEQVGIGESVSDNGLASKSHSETGLVSQALTDFNAFTGPPTSDNPCTPRKKESTSPERSTGIQTQAAKQSESPKNRTPEPSPKPARNRSPAFSLAAFLTERLRPDQKNKGKTPVSPVSPLTSPTKRSKRRSQLFKEADSKETSAGEKLRDEKGKCNERKQESSSLGSSVGLVQSPKPSALLLVDYSSSDSEGERETEFISVATREGSKNSTIASSSDEVVEILHSETQIQPEEVSSIQDKENVSSETHFHEHELSTDHPVDNLDKDELSPNTPCDTQLISSEKDPKQDKRAGSCIDLLSDESNVNPQEGRDVCNNAELSHLEEHTVSELPTQQSNMEMESSTNISSNLMIAETMGNEVDTGLCDEQKDEAEANVAGSGRENSEEEDKITCRDSSADSEELNKQKDMEQVTTNTEDENNSNEEVEEMTGMDFEVTHNHEVDQADQEKSMNEEFEGNEKYEEESVETGDRKHDSGTGEDVSETDDVKGIELVEDLDRPAQLETGEEGKESGQRDDVESAAKEDDVEDEVPTSVEAPHCVEPVPASSVSDSPSEASNQCVDFQDTQGDVLREPQTLLVDNPCEQQSGDEKATEVFVSVEEKPDDNSVNIVPDCEGFSAEMSLEKTEKNVTVDFDQQNMKELASQTATDSFDQTHGEAEFPPSYSVLGSSNVTEDRSIEEEIIEAFTLVQQKTNAIPTNSGSVESNDHGNTFSISDDEQSEAAEKEIKNKNLAASQNKREKAEDVVALLENQESYQTESAVNEESDIGSGEKAAEQETDLKQNLDSPSHQSVESRSSPEGATIMSKSNVEADCERQPIITETDKSMEELNEEEDLSDYDLVIEKDTTSRNSFPPPFLQSTRTSKFNSFETSFAAENDDQAEERPVAVKARKARNTAQVLSESSLSIEAENRAGAPEVTECPRRYLGGAKSLRNKVNSKQFVWEVDDEDSGKHVTGSAGWKAMHTSSKDLESSIAVLERKRKALREKLETESSPFTWDLEESPEKPCQSRTESQPEKLEALGQSQRQKSVTPKEDAKCAVVSDELRKLTSEKFQRRKRTASAAAEAPNVAKRVRRTSDKKSNILSSGGKNESDVKKLGKSSLDTTGHDSFIDICDSDVSFKRDSLTSEQISLLSGEKVTSSEHNTPVNENETVKKRGRGRPRKLECYVLGKADNKIASENLDLGEKKPEPKNRPKRRSKITNDQHNNESEKISHGVKREMKDKQSIPASKRARNSERNNEDSRDPKLKKAGLIRVNQNNTNSDSSTPMTRSSDAAMKAFNQKSLRNRGVSPASTPPSTPPKPLPHPRNGPETPPSKLLPGPASKSSPTSVVLSGTKVSTGLDKQSQAASPFALSQQQPAVARSSTKVSRATSAMTAASPVSNSTAVVKRRAPAKSVRKVQVPVKSKAKGTKDKEPPHTTVYRVEPAPNSLPKRGHKAPLNSATKGSQPQTVHTPLAPGMLPVKPKRESKLKWKISKASKSSKSKAPIIFKRAPT